MILFIFKDFQTYISKMSVSASFSPVSLSCFPSLLEFRKKKTFSQKSFESDRLSEKDGAGRNCSQNRGGGDCGAPRHSYGGAHGASGVQESRHGGRKELNTRGGDGGRGG